MLSSNHEDTSDSWPTQKFIDNMYPSFYLDPAEQALSEPFFSALNYESTMTCSTQFEDLYPPNSPNKLQLNDFLMQNSCDIPPSLSVVPPINQALEDVSIFDLCLAEQQQELDLQKNLVKDVFFSPAMIDQHTRNSSLLSLFSSESNNDDCHSVVSDSTATSSSSSSYCYAKEDDEDLELPSQNPDQEFFFYGLGLSETATATTIAGDHDDITKVDGLGTTATSSKSTKSTGCNRRTKQRVYEVSNDGRSPFFLTAKKTICRKVRSKLVSKKRSKGQIKQTEKILPSESVYHTTSDAISCYSRNPNVTSAWEYKRTDNKNDTRAEIVNVEEVFKSDKKFNHEYRSIRSPTLYQKLSKQSIDWCRYCGTTEGVNWRPGPWGKRTLCNKHGCDYKGYGFACKLPRLDLTAFASETITERVRPVMQSYCSECQRQESWEDNNLVLCDGCPKAYHQNCYRDNQALTNDFINSNTPWYCNFECQDNLKRKKVVVELPRKRLPLMRTPKNAIVDRTDTVNLTMRLPRSLSRERSKSC